MTPLDRLKNDLLHVLRASHFRLYGETFDLIVLHNTTSNGEYVFRFSSRDISNYQIASRSILEPLTSYGLEYENDMKNPEDANVLFIFDNTAHTRDDYYSYSLYIGSAKESRLVDPSKWKTVLTLSPYFAFYEPDSKNLYSQAHLKYDPAGEFHTLTLRHRDRLYWMNGLSSEYYAHLNDLYIKALSFKVQEHIGSMLAELDQIPGLIKYYDPDERKDFSLFFFLPGEVKLSEQDALILLTGMVMRFRWFDI